MNTAQCAITIFDRIDNDAHGNEIENFIELTTLLHHFFVNAPQVLSASSYFCLDPQLRELDLDVAHYFGEIYLALWRARSHQVV